MNGLTVTALVLTIIALVFLIFGIMYFIVSQRRRSILYKKVDFLVEDLTNKSETLTSTVDTVAKMSNYVDVFEVFARKNIKSLARVLARNKDDIYKIADRLKRAALGEKPKQDKYKGKKRGGK